MASEDRKDWLTREVKPLAGGAVMHKPVEEMTMPEAVTAWAVSDFVEGKCEKRKAVIRERLLREADTTGEPDEGDKVLRIEGTKIIRELRIGKNPNEEGLAELLRTKGISIDEAFDEKKELVLNPSKVDFLVQTGKLSKEEVDKLKKTTVALKVKPSTELSDLLEEAARRYALQAAEFGATPELSAKKPPAKNGKKAKKR